MTTINFKKLGFLSLAAAVLVVAGADFAHATQDFAGSVQKVGDQAEALPGFIQFICYVLGIGLVAKGILAGKKYSENPAQATGGLLAVIGPLAVGGLLIALPAVSDTVINSVLQNDTANRNFQQGFSGGPTN
ncbi:MAG: DUF6750 family protein [Bdellovibrionales bacterium]